MRKKRGVWKKVVRSRSRVKKRAKKSKKRIIKKRPRKRVKKRTIKRKIKKKPKGKSTYTYLRQGTFILPKLSYISIMNKDGNIKNKKAFKTLKLKSATIKEWYQIMILARTFDQKCLNLQKQGRSGTYLSIKGQEACQIPAVHNLKETDWVVPAFRENAALISRNVPLVNLFLYWGGDERGHHPREDKQKLNYTPVAVPVGTHPLHAVGIGMAAKIKKQDTVIMTFCGDGATSEGDFSEALNFAGVYKSPVIFMVQNNQYAISLPVTKQTAASSIAQKALAFGLEGIQVDGNDAFAVYKATKYAVDKARKGGGPTLIECVTYRFGDHSTADDAKVYRNDAELKFMEQFDPVKRIESYMKKKKIITDKEIKNIAEKAKQQVEKAVEEYENVEPAALEDIFNYQFAELTPQLKEQMAFMLETFAGAERQKNPIIEKIEGGFP